MIFISKAWSVHILLSFLTISWFPNREYRDWVAPNRECRDRFDILPIANVVIELLPITNVVIGLTFSQSWMSWSSFSQSRMSWSILSSFLPVFYRHSAVFHELWSSWLKLWTWQDCLNISQSHPGHSKHCSSPAPSALLNFSCARTLCWHSDCIGVAIASARLRRHRTPARALADTTIGAGQSFPCREYIKCFTDNCQNWWFRR